MSALRLVVVPAGNRRRRPSARLYMCRAGCILPAGMAGQGVPLGLKLPGGWVFAEARSIDHPRLARIVHLVPSTHGQVGKAILAGDDRARLRALRGGGAAR